jgi:hypothetical protein
MTTLKKGFMKINIEDIQKNLDQRKEWNLFPLDKIEFYENGIKLEIPKDVIIQFEKIGLNNVDFITSGYYKRKF